MQCRPTPGQGHWRLPRPTVIWHELLQPPGTMVGRRGRRDVAPAHPSVMPSTSHLYVQVIHNVYEIRRRISFIHSRGSSGVTSCLIQPLTTFLLNRNVRGSPSRLDSRTFIY